MKYKTKPIEIEAVQWLGDNAEEVIEFAEKCNATQVIFDLDGTCRANIKVKDGTCSAWRGDFFVLKESILYSMPGVSFNKEFEEVEQEDGDTNV